MDKTLSESADTIGKLLASYHTYNRRPDIRHKRVKDSLFKSYRRTLGPWLPPNRSAKILDAGCGEGNLLYFLKELGYDNMAGFDISSENVAICHSLGLTFVRQFNALAIDQFSGALEFDVIFATDVIEHLPKEKAGNFLKQIYDRLLPGGYVVIQTPNMGSILGLHARYYDLSHEFGVTEKSAVDLLMLAGFDPQPFLSG